MSEQGESAGSSVEGTVTELLDALEAKDSELPDRLLELTSEDDAADRAVVDQMGRLLHAGWKCVNRRRLLNWGSEELVVLARRSASTAETSMHVRTALDHLALWSEVDAYLAANGWLRTPFHELFPNDDSIRDLRDRLTRCGSQLSTNYGALMHEAMLASVCDRRAAHDLFRSSRAANPEFADSSFLDQFASTYFSRDSIEENSVRIAQRRASLVESVESLSASSWGDQDSTLLLFSCDPTYFTSHFPYWASAIQYLCGRNVGLHFLIVGDRQRVMTMVEECAAVIESISRLRGCDGDLAGERVAFSRVSEPEYVGEATTFYACARFLLARKLAQGFAGRVVILDIDMMVRDDPTPFLRHLHALPDDRLPVAIGRGMASLMPARRYLAGTLPVPVGELGEQFMRDLEDYIYTGLSRPISWTLDQNALTYAVEGAVATQGLATQVSLGDMGQPFMQWALAKGLYVSEQRRLERMSPPVEG